MEWIESIRKDPEIFEKTYSRINIRTLRGLVKVMVSR